MKVNKTVKPGRVLPKEFFARPVLTVAPELLGKILVRRVGKKIVRSVIHEVEAYDGVDDLACHASKGETKRTKVMFGEAGIFYIYLVYGMYYMLNVVTDTPGYPSAILIRGAGRFSGPGKLTRGLDITKNFNGRRAEPESDLWFEDEGIVPEKIIQTPRIGINCAGPIWSQKPYRFFYKK